MLPSLLCILLTLHSGLNNHCFLYWKVIQNSFLFQVEPWCRQVLCGCTCHSLWGRWPEYTHWENKVLRLLDPGSHLRLYRCGVVFQPHYCQACCPGCTEAQEVQSYSFICEAYCSCQAYAGIWHGMPPQTSLWVARPEGCLHEGSQDWAAVGCPRWCSWQGPSCVQPKLGRGMK